MTLADLASVAGEVTKDAIGIVGLLILAAGAIRFAHVQDQMTDKPQGRPQTDPTST